MRSTRPSEETVDSDQRIVVDGYNVIYADDSLRRFAVKSMERARRVLLSRIAAYLADKDLRVTVVFDGRGAMTDADVMIPGKLQVVYSAHNQSADDLIVSIVTTSGNPRAYIVVTSDRAHIGPAVAECGCKVMGSVAFLERLQAKQVASSATGDEDKPAEGGDQLDYWMERFRKEPRKEDKLEEDDDHE